MGEFDLVIFKRKQEIVVYNKKMFDKVDGANVKYEIVDASHSVFTYKISDDAEVIMNESDKHVDGNEFIDADYS